MASPQVHLLALAWSRYLEKHARSGQAWSHALLEYSPPSFSSSFCMKYFLSLLGGTGKLVIVTVCFCSVSVGFRKRKQLPFSAVWSLPFRGDNWAHRLLLWLAVFYQQPSLWQTLCLHRRGFRRKSKSPFPPCWSGSCSLCLCALGKLLQFASLQMYRAAILPSERKPPWVPVPSTPLCLKGWIYDPGIVETCLFWQHRPGSLLICSRILLTW